MVVITAPTADVEAGALAGKARDALRLTWEERRWTRKRVWTESGRELALALPTGTRLRPGAVIAVGPDWYAAVEAREEPVIAIAPRDGAEAVRVAFDVGNRHFPLAVHGDRLLVPDDSAMEQLARRLDLVWERCRTVFEPLDRPRHA
jgi:urease accessory protein